MKKKQSSKKLQLNRQTVATLKSRQMAAMNGGAGITDPNGNDSIRVVPCPASPLCMDTFWKTCQCDDTLTKMNFIVVANP
jgi:hypothetical protein